MGPDSPFRCCLIKETPGAGFGTMPVQRGHGIILKVVDFGESDRIVVFFTQEFGLLRGFAKGARKSTRRFGNCLSLFRYVRFHFVERKGSDLVRIDRCDLLKSFDAISLDLVKIVYGSYLVEITSAFLGERQQESGALRTILYAFGLLEREAPREQTLRMFEARIFKELGLMPQFGSCVGCGRESATTKTLRFSAADGGVLCENCMSGREGLIPLTIGTARILDHTMLIDLDRLGRLGFSAQSLKESRQVMQSFVRYRTGREPRSLRFMAEVRAGGYPWP